MELRRLLFGGCGRSHGQRDLYVPLRAVAQNAQRDLLPDLRVIGDVAQQVVERHYRLVVDADDDVTPGPAAVSFAALIPAGCFSRGGSDPGTPGTLLPVSLLQSSR